MPKYLTTVKEIKQNEKVVIGFSYCQLDSILQAINPILYTTTQYGWGSDYYRLPNGWLLSTGYRPLDYTFGTIGKDENIKKEIERITKALKDANEKTQGLNLEQLRALFNSIF